jgi:mono/diheme cytochrome c family protein
MPPYAHLLDDAELAALLTWLRVSWGHQASALSSAEVGQWRGSR